MPAMPFPCAKAEAVAAIISAAERINFCLMFLFINCSCFCRQKSGWSFVGQLILGYFTLV